MSEDRSTVDESAPAGGQRRRREPPVPRCVLDTARPCHGCVADSPATCPYPYLMGWRAEPS